MKKTALALAIALALVGCRQADQSASTDGQASLSPATRKGAPEFDLENVAGGTTKAAELKGKISIVDFWATWCEPCIVEIPRFNQLHEAYKDKPVQIIAITVESEHETIAPKVKETGMKYPVLVGDDKVVDGFGGVIGFPTTFVLTKDWKIYKKYMGAMPNKQEKIKQDIEKLMQEESSTTD